MKPGTGNPQCETTENADRTTHPLRRACGHVKLLSEPTTKSPTKTPTKRNPPRSANQTKPTTRDHKAQTEPHTRFGGHKRKPATTNATRKPQMPPRDRVNRTHAKGQPKAHHTPYECTMANDAPCQRMIPKRARPHTRCRGQNEYHTRLGGRVYGTIRIKSKAPKRQPTPDGHAWPVETIRAMVDR
ncbi:hypothetical protein BS47DRAFT_1359895 [Hydnum rufescens UP504]|uniref:Uncharacterized protein n=1 Tax=Hydnum rufescens UP504 TaxID=1448309 RepID=A0A9P6DZV8_9AGAM|nr:hypothetical protein BS47DRAFT_1359895 [Hydnum rufescens UP504]